VLFDCLVGGIARWLRHWSLAGVHSLIYAWSMVDSLPLCG